VVILLQNSSPIVPHIIVVLGSNWNCSLSHDLCKRHKYHLYI